MLTLVSLKVPMVWRGMVTLITKQMLPSIIPHLRHQQTAMRGLLVGPARTEMASVRGNFNSAMSTGRIRSQVLLKGSVDGEPLTERMAKSLITWRLASSTALSIHQSGYAWPKTLISNSVPKPRQSSVRSRSNRWKIAAGTAESSHR